MSIFTEISPDDILLQKYYLCHEDCGDCLKPIQIDRNNYEDTYLDIDLCWKQFVWDRKASLNYRYNINIKRLSKEPWLRALNQELHFNRIKTLVLRGKTYYNAYDLYQFHLSYELMVVWRYCKYHKIHWNGYEHMMLTDEDMSDSYECVRMNVL